MKVTVPRSLMFTSTGHRPATQQRMRLGATQDGKLVSIQHDVLQETSMVDNYVERCTDPTPDSLQLPQRIRHSAPGAIERRHADADARPGHDAGAVRHGVRDG